MKEIAALFKRNFPYIVRDEEAVISILQQEDTKVIEKRNETQELIGVSVINRNTILLFCVDEAYRKQGIGTELLIASERMIKEAGYKEVTVGAGYTYLMPGVPTSKRYFAAVNERLYDGLNEEADDFFTKRGYVHSRDCNIFDMRFPLSEFCKEEHRIGDTIDGILYRFAEWEDLENICRCTDDALEEFTQWYRNEDLYKGESASRVLLALREDEVVGAVIVGVESAEESLGSVGCTSVKHNCRGRHVAVNMVTLGTRYLRDMGLQEAYLSYTYSGLDHMYGYAGYKICVYYMMAQKSL